MSDWIIGEPAPTKWALRLEKDELFTVWEKKYYTLRDAVIDYKRKLEAGEAYNSALICEATKDLFELVNDDKGKVNNE
jgi:hypothetical protein